MQSEKMKSVVSRGVGTFGIRATVLAAIGSIAGGVFAQDECTSAVTLQTNVTQPFSTVGMTPSVGVPLDTLCSGTNLLWTSTSPDVWFKWVAPSDGLATFNTCSAATSTIDTSMALYVGACGTLAQVACNGDPLHNNNGGCNPTDAKIANFAVTAGTVYFVRVAGIESPFGVAVGSGQITVNHTHIAAWGDNIFNQCDIPASAGSPTKLSVGDSHALAIKADGTIVAWGSNSLGQGNVPAGISSPIDIAAGVNYSLAIRSTGALVGWGSNTSGRATPPTTFSDFTAVAAGGFHGLAMRANGTVVAWGAGLTNTSSGSSWGQSIVPANLGACAKIAAGYMHSVAIQSNGNVVAWGAGVNNTGALPQFGQANVPGGTSNVTKIASGYYHNVALRSNGAVVCWGAGSVNTGTSPQFGQSIVPSGLTGVVDVAAGRYHTVALRSDGSVAAWGLNTDYQLSIPVNMGAVDQIAAGGNVTVARFAPCGPTSTRYTYYRDADGDGFGSAAVTTSSCDTTAPTGYVTNASDCDDAAILYADADTDSYGAGAPAACGVASNNDCNDAAAGVNPGASELCDASDVDENCNGVADNADALALDAGKTNFYADADADTYSVSAATRFCDLPATGYVVAVTAQIDCNDAVAAVNPGATELCDAANVDENCNGLADNLDSGALASSKSDFFADVDADGYSIAEATRFCDLPATGYLATVSNPIDCNDGVNTINPGANELCDASNVDENCNGTSDNADATVLEASKLNFYADSDSDTYTVAAATRFCDIVTGYRSAVSAQIDCNDADTAVNPGANEICDAGNVDENCDDLADNADPGAVEASKSNFYADADGDTYTVVTASRFCDMPAGYRAAASAQPDCDESSSATHPGAAELCSTTSVDNNCDTVIDDVDALAADKVDFFTDSDADGHSTLVTAKFCPGTVNAGFIAIASAQVDCNDADAAINPSAIEICDAGNIDENCTGTADNADAGALASSKSDFFADADADAYTVANATRFCDIVDGYLASASAQVDCDDASAIVHPGAVELCSTTSVDNNCDTVIDDVDALAADKVDFFADSDADGHSTLVTAKFCPGTVNAGFLAAASAQVDCDDASPAVHPGAVELCSTTSVDNNCDTVIDDVDALAADKVDYFADSDSDTFTSAVTAKFCPDTVNAGFLASASAALDCNDASATVHPGAVELCSTISVDNNCDTVIDDVDALAADKVDFFRDADADGHSTLDTAKFCPDTVNAGYLAAVSSPVDCDDASATVHPGAVELCSTTSVDNNCDTVIDDVDALAADKVDFFTDSDNDGHSTIVTAKFCPGTVNAGFIAVASAQVDCDDASAAVHPGAVELCSTTSVDNNCDTVIDDVDALAADKVDFFRDADLDGHSTLDTAKFCPGTSNAGYLATVSSPVDCNDASAIVHPGAAELCSTPTVDNNCDGTLNDVDAGAADKVMFYADGDLDTFTTEVTSAFCSGTINAGYLEARSAVVDCNDADATVHPGAVELCSNLGVDNNCNQTNTADEAVDSASYCIDADSDGFGFGAIVKACQPMDGFVGNAADCDDTSAGIHPGAAELCADAGIDNNCNSVATDIDALAADKADFFADSDNDGHSTLDTAKFCPGTVNAGYLASASIPVDCDDASALVYPGAAELCSTATVDNNCDSVASDVDALAADKVDFFRDADADGHSTIDTAKFCPDTVIAGYLAAVSSPVDCDDASALVHPGAAELCSTTSVDNNCDTVIDDVDALAADKVDYFADSDSDTFTSAVTAKFCPDTVNAGYLASASAQVDCDDASSLVYPGAAELCSTATVDNNCDSVASDVDDLAADKVDFFRDADADGHSTLDTARFCPDTVNAGYLAAVSSPVDCDDASALVHPGAAELCSTATVDNNCDSVATDIDALAADKVDYFADSDSDTFTSAVTAKFCPDTVNAGFLASATAQVDCDDASALVYPGAAELCSTTSVDNNCDTVIDDVDALAADKVDYFADSDSDTFTSAVTAKFCPDTVNAGFLAVASAQVDCDDASALVYPGAAELCSTATVDNNCDSVASDVDALAADKVDFFRDADADGHSTIDTAKFCPDTVNAGYLAAVSSPVDCDDASALVHPGAAELCSTTSVDNNCDTVIDDVDALAADKVDYFADSDSDTFTSAVTAKFCPDTVNAGFLAVASAQVDCDDASSLVYPGAAELCSTATVDNNCDSVASDVDDLAADKVDFFRDADADGHSTLDTAKFCPDTVNAGYLAAVSSPVDCDDASALVHPGAAELCSTATVDNNCDSVATDIDALAADKVSFYRDADGDGYTTAQTASYCPGSTVAGWSETASAQVDCNDSAAGIHPGAAELCIDSTVDNNCDGTVNDVDAGAADKVMYYQDGDLDTFTSEVTSAFCSGTINAGYLEARSALVDCNDADAAVFPGAIELCSNLGVDNNCNTTNTADEAVDSASYCVDADGDGFGFGAIVKSCQAMDGYVGNGADCDDTQFLYADADGDGFGAGVPVACGVASNTDNCPANGSLQDAVTFYGDADADTFGDAAVTTAVCETTAPIGFVSAAGDNCPANGSLQNAVTYYGDADADTFGDAAVTTAVCETTAPIGFVSAAGDNCPANGSLQNAVTYFADADQDGFGALASTTSVCETAAPAGFVVDSSDCNDAALLYIDADGDGHGAGAAVACGVTSNDDACADNAQLLAAVTYYGDADADTFGDAAVTTAVCETTAPIGFVSAAGDNCPANGQLQDAVTFYGDSDSDGFGDAAVTTSVCETIAPAGYVSAAGDACPTNGTLQAPATFYADADNDGAGDPLTTETSCTMSVGYVAVAGDNCPANGQLVAAVTYYADSDNDGFGALASTTSVCETAAPAGFVVDSSDCNDAALLYIDADGDGHGAGAAVACGVTSNDDACADNAQLLAAVTYYGDADADTFGDAAVTTAVCETTAPVGFVSNTGDNCPANGSLQNAVTYYGDADADTFGDAAVTTAVCETTAPIGFVSAAGDNCPANGSLQNAVTYFADADQDGFGALASTTSVCETAAPAGFVVDSSDCNDAALLYADADGDGHGAGAAVACGVTSNDDACADNAQLLAAVTYYGDADADTFGDAAVTTAVCETTAPIGFVSNTGDNCPANGSLQNAVTYYGDADADTFGDAAVTTAVCETTAPIGFVSAAGDNCPANGSLQNAVTYFADADQDGFGALASTTSVCETAAPAGFVVDSSDCNDAALLYIDADGDGHGAGAAVACGVTSNDDACADNAQLLAAVTYYGDADADTFGDAAVTTAVCETTAPIGFVSAAGDNCPANGSLQNAVTYFADADQDGFGALASTTSVCETAAPAGFVVDSSDCNDAALLYADADGDGHGAGAAVACGVTSNDDACADNAQLLAAVTYYADSDNDGFGALASTTSVCETAAPAGFVVDSSDCNDAALLYADADGDGHGAGAAVACGVASNDDGCPSNAQLLAAATFYADADGDGAGDASVTTAACEQPAGYVTAAGDNCPSNGLLTSPLTYYRDADNDGAGDVADSIQSCESSAPAGYATTSNDGCPSDGNKTAPGTCGCGVADTDTDADGTPDCTDLCPSDPAKTAPGTCGCGVVDSDTDGDGRADCIDNCPSIANPDQRDCNNNGTGDVCELAAGSATDCNSNGVIDSCDLTSGTSTDIDLSGTPDECEFVVGGSGYASIQDAIDFAPNGTTIKVGPGIWAPITVIKRGLTIQSIAGDRFTFIDGGTTSRCIEVTGRASIRFTLRGFTIRNGAAAEGAGMLIQDADPVIESCVFTHNVSTGQGGAIRAINSSADIAGSTFNNNTASSGGAIASTGLAPSNGVLHVSNGLFTLNSAATDGGAILNAARMFLLECTLERNAATGLGGAIRQLETGDLTLFTCRLCRNLPENISGAFTGVGDNILSQDCNGNGVCDADEIADGTVVDCNANGIPDACDISSGAAADCNSNGIPDSCDISAGTSTDVDANGIPDECKPDCNGNDIPDAYEIATGAATDCNTNGIPDSCDISANASLDCNANGQLDSCELASGTARDCNSNGVIDSCDIATGAADIDRDGRLDLCEIRYGDLSLDGIVNGVDLAIILTNWGSTNSPSADVNGDGTVDAQDLAIVLGRWGVVPN